MLLQAVRVARCQTDQRSLPPTRHRLEGVQPPRITLLWLHRSGEGDCSNEEARDNQGNQAQLMQRLVVPNDSKVLLLLCSLLAAWHEKKGQAKSMATIIKTKEHLLVHASATMNDYYTV